MALIKCPECGKEVSNTAYNCPNCNYAINKPKRGVFGKIFKIIFLVFNIFMIVWIISVFSIDTGVPVDDSTAKGIGIVMLIMIWVFLGLPLGILSYITRGKKS